MTSVPKRSTTCVAGWNSPSVSDVTQNTEREAVKWSLFSAYGVGSGQLATFTKPAPRLVVVADAVGVVVGLLRACA